MQSQVGILNTALTLLGEGRVTSIDDDVKPAREGKALWDIALAALLAGYNWSFAMSRRQLVALAAAPEFGYNLKYNLPGDCMRLVMIGGYYAGIDLTNYRNEPDQEMWTIEGREILTNLAAPLDVRFVKLITDTATFHPSFDMTLAAYLAMLLAEPLTQSDQKRERAERQYKHELSVAIRANAIELPPKNLPDDEWAMARR